jgi:hypothetical protein
MALGPNALLARGHVIENSGWFPNYHNDGPPRQYAFPRADMQRACENWEVHEFAGPFFSPSVDGQNVQDPPEEISPDDPRNLGTKVNVRTGDPINGETEQSIAGIRTFLRVVAQKIWGSPRLTDGYGGFLPIMDVVGHAPGYELDARLEHALPEPSAVSRAVADIADLLQVWTLRRHASS